MTEPFGRAWCARFPTSVSIADLKEPFRTAVSRFLAALTNAEDSCSHAPYVHVSVTYRPPERAYLMHTAWQIAHGLADPAGVPAFPGLSIDWTHGGDHAAAVAAAKDMVAEYDIAFAPSGPSSRHCSHEAVDMTIKWDGTLNIRNAHGTLLAISSAPHDGTNPELAKIGAEFGVIKLVGDKPHWSIDGH